MNIHNMTPHVVTLIVEGVRVDYPSEGVIRAKQVDSKIGVINSELKINAASAGIEIPVFKSTFGAPEGVPEEIDPNGIYVVSMLAYQSLRTHGYNMDKYYIVSGTIRDESGKIVGCKGLAKA